MYEDVVKNELTKSMNVHISPFNAAYQKNYNTQHVLLRLLGEWRAYLDNHKTMGEIFMDFTVAFMFRIIFLLAKLAAYGFDDNLILYMHSYLLHRKQWV